MADEKIGALLHKAIVTAVGAVIDGVTIGDPADKATWTIQFTPEASKANQAAARAVLAAFDPTAPVVIDATKEAAAKAAAGSVPIRAFYRFWFFKTNGRYPTPEEAAADLADFEQAFKDVT